jgi:hypothetical protein
VHCETRPAIKLCGSRLRPQFQALHRLFEVARNLPVVRVGDEQGFDVAVSLPQFRRLAGKLCGEFGGTRAVVG